MLGNDVLHQNIAADGCGRSHIGTGFNLIGDNAVIGAMQHIYPTDFNDIGAGAADIRSHGIEEVGQIDNMRFFGHIFQHRHAAGLYCRQHYINGSAHRDLIEVDMGALHPLGIGINKAIFNADFRAQKFKTFDVLIDGANAKIAAAGHGNTGLPKAPQQRADKIVAGAHMLGKFVRNRCFGKGGSIDNRRSTAEFFYGSTHSTQHTEQQLRIMDIGDIFQHTAAPGQHRGGNNGNSGIFRAADGNLSRELFRAVYNEFLHWMILVIFYIFR